MFLINETDITLQDVGTRTQIVKDLKLNLFLHRIEKHKEYDIETIFDWCINYSVITIVSLRTITGATEGKQKKSFI